MSEASIGTARIDIVVDTSNMEAAIKRAGAWSGSVRVSVTHADPPRPVPGSGIRPKKTPAPSPEMSVFAGIDIGAFINAEMAQLRN